MYSVKGCGKDGKPQQPKQKFTGGKDTPSPQFSTATPVQSLPPTPPAFAFSEICRLLRNGLGEPLCQSPVNPVIPVPKSPNTLTVSYNYPEALPRSSESVVPLTFLGSSPARNWAIQGSRPRYLVHEYPHTCTLSLKLQEMT
jgi:hypothetical protein